MLWAVTPFPFPPMKAIFCIPTYDRPHEKCLASLGNSVPLLEAQGWEHGVALEVGSPYISHARSKLLRKALDGKPDVIVFIDHDISWEPPDLLKLIGTKGEVVAGLYRYKDEPERYMGVIQDDPLTSRPIVREDGCMQASLVPAGFLKINPVTVNIFMDAYPELNYGSRYSPSTDLFNHGAYKGEWWGEDFAFSRRWTELDEKIWVVPNLNLTHHDKGKDYPGNFHEFMLRQPGGSKDGPNK